MPAVSRLAPLFGFVLLAAVPLFCQPPQSVAAQPEVEASPDESQDLSAITKAIDELPTLPPARQKVRAQEIIDTYHARYSDASESPEFAPIRDLKNLLDGIEELPTLSVRQQRPSAEALISEYAESFPGFFPIDELKRFLREAALFDAMRQNEQQRREAASEWARVYWQSLCCPLPQWEPPVGRLRNETGLDVLYEQCLEGIHQSRWSGPYRLADGSELASPFPFHIRCLSRGTVQAVRIVPGEVYVFRGSPADGTLELVPSFASPMVTPDGGVTVPAPAPSGEATVPNEPPATESYDPAPAIDGPMILP
ncbi:MAG: hypothetical protein WBC44_14380 [Planctomycetaceae bacterium]